MKSQNLIKDFAALRQPFILVTARLQKNEVADETKFINEKKEGSMGVSMYSDEEKRNILNKITEARASGMTAAEAIKVAGISNNTYHQWKQKIKPQVLVHDAPETPHTPRTYNKKPVVARKTKYAVVIVNDAESCAELIRQL